MPQRLHTIDLTDPRPPSTFRDFLRAVMPWAWDVATLASMFGLLWIALVGGYGLGLH